MQYSLGGHFVLNPRGSELAWFFLEWVTWWQIKHKWGIPFQKRQSFLIFFPEGVDFFLRSSLWSRITCFHFNSEEYRITAWISFMWRGCCTKTTTSAWAGHQEWFSIFSWGPYPRIIYDIFASHLKSHTANTMALLSSTGRDAFSMQEVAAFQDIKRDLFAICVPDAKEHLHWSHLSPD